MFFKNNEGGYHVDMQQIDFAGTDPKVIKERRRETRNFWLKVAAVFTVIVYGVSFAL